MHLSNSKIQALFIGLGNSGKRRRCVSKLYDCFAPQFHARLIARGIKESDERDTIIQDTFVNLLHHADNKIASNESIAPEYPKAWFHRILANCLYQYLRDNRRTVIRESLDDNEPGNLTDVVPDQIRTTQADVLGEIIKSGSGRDENSSDISIGGEPAPVTEFRISFQKVYGRYAGDYPLCAFAQEQVVIEQVSLQELSTLLGKKYGATRQFISDCRKKLVALWKRHCHLPQ
jgi:DNA-directed RNA polymerase specialized sigma24 family protein